MQLVTCQVQRILLLLVDHLKDTRMRRQSDQIGCLVVIVP